MSMILDIEEKLESIRLHTGREQAVFALNEGTNGLLNIHEALMNKVFNGSEKIKYLLYSPMYFSETTPFKAKSLPASSSLLATDNKFVITKNYHSSEKHPQIYIIDFSDILALELGKATIMGWFRIEFVYKGAKKEVSVIFSASSGMFHFSNLIKVYTGVLDKLYPLDDARYIYQGSELLNSLMDNVSSSLRIDKFSVWRSKKNIFGFENKMLLSPACTVFVEKRGIVIIEERKGKLLPEDNVSFIPYFNIRDCKSKIYRDNTLTLVLNLADTGYMYEIVFDREEQSGEATRLAEAVEKRIGCLNNDVMV